MQQKSLDSLDVLQARHSGMTSEQGLRVRLLMCPRRIEQTQFWTISALRIFAAAEPPSGLPSSAQHLPAFQVSSIQISRTVPFLRITNSNDFVFCPLNLRCSWSLRLTAAVVRIKVDIFDVCLPVSWLSGALVLIQLRAYFAMNSIVQWDCCQSKHRTFFGIQAAAWTFSN